jgi:hypothetical protein
MQECTFKALFPPAWSEPPLNVQFQGTRSFQFVCLYLHKENDPIRLMLRDDRPRMTVAVTALALVALQELGEKKRAEYHERSQQP